MERPARFFTVRCAGLLALLASLSAPQVQAAELEDPARIQAIASAYAIQHAGPGRVDASAQLPDTRLRLPRCTQTPQASARTHGLRMQVQVHCPGQWKLYVPVVVQQHKQVVVSARSLNAHELIGAADVTLAWRQMQGVDYGSFESLEAVIGRELAQPLAAGQILKPNQLRQAPSIRKGDTVTLLSRVGSVEIRGRGKAQHDAVEHSRVKVRNLSSGRIVEGYVRPGGIVEIRG